MNEYGLRNYTRLQKRTARKLFNEGQAITIAPCKANPESPWGLGVEVTKKDGDFDKIVDNFSYYNCQYNELGKYPAYYKAR